MPRILTAVVVLPFLIASILFPVLAPLFVVMAAAAMVFGLYEFYVLAKKKGMQPDVVAGYLASAALFTIFYFANRTSLQERLDLQSIILVLLILTIGTLVAAMLRGAPFDKMLASSGATILGVLYVVLLGGHLVAVRMGFPSGLSSAPSVFFLFGADGVGHWRVLRRQGNRQT